MKKAQERAPTNVSDMEAAIRECEDARDTLLGARRKVLKSFRKNFRKRRRKHWRRNRCKTCSLL